MFTTEEYRTVLDSIEAKKVGHYSITKNAFSYEVSQLQDGNDRGEFAEKMVANRLRLSGVDAQHVGGKGQPDIRIVVDGNINRGEVKSSLLGRTSNKYEFVGIDPEELDNLFLAFIHPVRGLVVKTVAKPHLMQWIQIGGKGGKPATWCDEKDGYVLRTDANMTNPKIITTEWQGGPWT